MPLGDIALGACRPCFVFEEVFIPERERWGQVNYTFGNIEIDLVTLSLT
jgi:hypothetical protein